MLRTLPLLMMTACALGSGGDPDPASKSAELAGRAAGIADEAEAVGTLATELESMTDELRRQVAAGTLDKTEAARQLEAKMAEVDQRNKALQDAIEQLESDAREAAGMTPPEPVERR